MGTYSPEYCFLTDLKTENHPSSLDGIEYFIELEGQTYFFCFYSSFRPSQFIEQHKYLVKGLLLNNRFPKEMIGQLITLDQIENLIKTSIVPSDPKAKYDSLLVYLNDNQAYEGGEVGFYNSMSSKENLASKLFFKNPKEMDFYLETAKKQGHISGAEASTKEGFALNNMKFTFSGLEYLIHIRDIGSQSKNCFIAMSFSENMKETREAIKKSIVNCDYRPILIDEEHYESDVTINDAIISKIKDAKFVICDYTQHKHGVYFEAGYALGRGLPVIYVCSKGDFEELHFDVNHYPIIRYENFEELTQKLEDKIKAWID